MLMLRIYVDNNKYDLSFDTIKKFPESLLYKVYHGTETSPKIYEAYPLGPLKRAKTLYIDTDPEVFSHIVKFMRGYTLDIHDRTLLKNLTKDLEYFGLLDYYIDDILPLNNTNPELLNPNTFLMDTLNNITNKLKGTNTDNPLTSKLVTGDQQEKLGIIESLDKQLQESDPSQLIAQLSTDDNIKNIIKEYNNNQFQSDSDTDSIDLSEL